MSNSNAFKREIGFMVRDRAVLVWMVVVLCLSTVAVWAGQAEVQHQRDTIERLMILDEQDRSSEIAGQGDWGGAAYYSFHVTYDPPSNFAFAAMGQRDSSAWKHRLRMLALEGQIYEHDAGNPVLALIGRFDFVFFAAFVLPLVLIFLLHDLRASERVAGRYDLLVATLGRDGSFWWSRAFLRSLVIFIAAVIPLLIVGVISGTNLFTLLSAIVFVLAYLIFWTLVCIWFGRWQRSASVILAALIGVWVLQSTIIPAGGRLLIDKMVPAPSGADILMTQREAVNDAWDMPKEDTMRPFLERHPEWSNTAEIERPFEWKWYYAFQQVGDQTAEELSSDYTAGRIKRDRWAGVLAILAPPALLERSFQRLAGTDVTAVLAYENKVRAFHAELRAFYYPGLFGDQPFEEFAIENLPEFGIEEAN